MISPPGIIFVLAAIVPTTRAGFIASRVAGTVATFLFVLSPPPPVGEWCDMSWGDVRFRDRLFEWV